MTDTRSTPESDATKPKNRHRAEVAEYMNALVAERRRNADLSGDFLNHQALTGDRRDELATALGISVDAEDWWDRTADEQHKVLLGRISVLRALRTPQSESAATVWIPVSERLPENTTAYEVLALSVRGKVRVEAACEVVGLWNDAQRYEEKCAITHWQPLPESPK